MANSERTDLRVFLPLQPDEDMGDVSNLVSALFPAGQTRLRRLFVCRPLQADLFLPEMSFSLPEIARLELEAQMSAAHQARLCVQPLVDQGFRVESDVVTGAPVPEILREMNLWQADFCLVRARRPDADDNRLGALAAALLHQANTPVMTYRRVPDGYRMKRVLIATDFSDASRRSADWGLALAQAAGAEAHLLHVLARQANRSRLDEKALVAVATEEIERWRKRANPRFPRPATDAHVITAETPAEGILEFARDLGFDLTVLAGTGRSAFWSVVLGSNARSVVRLSDTPVTVIPSSNRVPVESFLEKLHRPDAVRRVHSAGAAAVLP
jgi:nucleotide-binding universal stress UspA family protein